MSTKAIEIYQTKDYGKFKLIKGNRKIDVGNVKQIQKSMSESYLFSPILVNENFEIIDGQNRFNAIKNLGLPLNYYIIEGYGKKEVKAINTNKKSWIKGTFIDAYVAQGREQYVKFNNFKNKYPDFSITLIENILVNENHSYNFVTKNAKAFERGEFKLTDEQWEAADELAIKLSEYKPHFDKYNSSTFARTMLNLFKEDFFNHERMINKLETHPLVIEARPTVKQYRELLEKIYNYKSRKTECVSFKY